MNRVLAAAVSLLLIAAAPAAAQERVALVIGNGKYVHAGALPNPANDSRAVGAALRDVGFEVLEGSDLDRGGMERLIRDFMRKSARASVAVMFYAGHGMQIDGRNYLLPVDAKLETATDLNFETIELDRLLDSLNDPNRATIVMLDACRDNPLSRSFARKSRSGSVGSGLAAYANPGTGTLIAFATAPGKVALDGDRGNSPFTEALVRHLKSPGLEVRQLLTRVRKDVSDATRGQQIPWDNSSLLGDVYLRIAAAPAERPVAAAPLVPRADNPTALEPAQPKGGRPAEPVRPRQNEVASLAPAPPARADPDVVAASTVDAIVTVSIERPAAPPSPESDKDKKDPVAIQSATRGLVVDPQGLIVVNAIVDAATAITATFRDGTKLRADVIGWDRPTGIALLRVKAARPLAAVRFGNSDHLQVGQQTAALNGAASITTLDREEPENVYGRLIELRPQNPMKDIGEPIFNAQSEVVGIVTLQTADRKIALAMSSNQVTAIVNELRNFGEVRRAGLGVRIQEVTDDIAKSLGLPQARGALIVGVNDNGPANIAGIEAGDVVVRFDGYEIKSFRDLPRLVGATPIGKAVDIVLVRSGNEMTKTAWLVQLESAGRVQPASLPGSAPDDKSTAAKALGLDLANISADLRKRYKVKGNVNGVVITAVAPNSAASGKGLNEGDVIVRVAEDAVGNTDDFQRRIEAAKKSGRKTTLLLVVNPKGEERFVALNSP